MGFAPAAEQRYSWTMTASADKAQRESGEAGLAGQLLIAMPQMSDPRFRRSVIYVCAHSDQGAMGLVVNKALPNLTFLELLEQLEINSDNLSRPLQVHFGGPVEGGRGFVLHSLDYRLPQATLQVAPSVGLTATVDVLRAIVRGEGPVRAFLALGYAGWAAGQLEDEIRANGWLHCPADDKLLFDAELDKRWQLALAKLGVEPSLLSSNAGTA